MEALRGLVGKVEPRASAYGKHLKHTYDAAGVTVPEKVGKAILAAAAVPDPDAPVITDPKGNPQPDPELRDNENIPLPADWLSLDFADRGDALREQAKAYLRDEIHPYAADAWIDNSKTKYGYEIPFTRHFYEYVPPRSLAEIDAELAETERKVHELISGFVQ